VPPRRRRAQLASTERSTLSCSTSCCRVANGLSVLRQLREARNTVPVILLTARDGLDERIEGLNLGADDYLTKPFSVAELIARCARYGGRLSARA